MNDPLNRLPRNMNLNGFMPHKKGFVCKHEADVVPPIDAQAQEWFDQAFSLTSRGRKIVDRDFKQAVVLYKKAAERKHWKAMINLASLYLNGEEGVPIDTEKGVLLVEEAMKLGIPSAFDLMGTLHASGTGVKRDISRAYAFWQLAAEMGSANAQAYLGYKFKAKYDKPPEFWANTNEGYKMMTCAFEQGDAKAAYYLGVSYYGDVKFREENAPSPQKLLSIFHQGVKYGSADCANNLFVRFDSGDFNVAPHVDKERARRYSVLGDALTYNPDLRFPNLDKVLPLPPAELPSWDGNEDKLIEAAKGVKSNTTPKKLPGHSMEGRYNIPVGYVLANTESMPPEPFRGFKSILSAEPDWGMARAPVEGYYKPTATAKAEASTHIKQDAQRINQYPPAFFKQGEEMRLKDLFVLDDLDYQRITWHYQGQAVPNQDPLNTLAQAGIVHAIDNSNPISCAANLSCPQTGIWRAELKPDHPQAKAPYAIIQWWHQAYVRAGQAFPTPQEIGLSPSIAATDLVWLGMTGGTDTGKWAWEENYGKNDQTMVKLQLEKERREKEKSKA